ncbi:hypothetical protein R5W24_002568 [Gemmata sp. JC717]|uniref:hypothetical protein n=1 Tax=Gemmata algarum TaxID=2975278 RepID=UPI0021BAD459|nr:hypothetical protein [Gemmata algarum]MDY3553466.1 hypothetical protein [Gemmata algarum]
MRVAWCAAVFVFAASLGCGKKPSAPAGPGAAEEGAPEPTGPAYSLKLRDRKASGDKWSVVSLKESRINAKIGPDTIIKTSSDENRYTQSNVSADGSKLVRAYQVSRETQDGGKTVTRTYSGKTVTIEKKNDIWTFTVAGKPISDAKILEDEFNSGGLSQHTAELLPKGPVKVNERWSVDRDFLRKLTRRSTVPIDSEKTTITGRLVKTYASEGTQWGVIEWDIELAMAGAKSGPQRVTGKMSYEGPIDGAKAESKIQQTVSGSWSETTPNGPANVELEESRTLTHSPQ